MSAEIRYSNKDISVFYQDALRKIWLDSDRPDTYMKDQKFRYFWDDRDRTK